MAGLIEYWAAAHSTVEASIGSETWELEARSVTMEVMNFDNLAVRGACALPDDDLLVAGYLDFIRVIPERNYSLSDKWWSQI